MKALATLILLTLSLSANAIYKCKTPEGKLVYSQIMCDGEITYLHAKKLGTAKEYRASEAPVRQEKRQTQTGAKVTAKTEAEKKLEKEHEMNEFKKLNKK